MGGRRQAEPTYRQPQPHPTSGAPRITPVRLACYLLAAMWLGAVLEANWADFLAADWFAFTTSAVLAVAWLVVLALMWRNDRRAGWIGGGR